MAGKPSAAGKVKKGAPKEKKVSTPEKTRKRIPGLCGTCRNEPTCTFPRRHGQPLLECDEFDGIERRDVIAERLTKSLLGNETVLARLYDGEEEEEEESEGPEPPKSGPSSNRQGENMATATVLKAEEKKTASAAKKTPAPLGLCSTCKLAATCTFPRQPGRPVRFCDEFEGEEKAEGTKPKPATKKVVVNELKGLCRLCDKAATCTFPKAEGGVWHCEEYE